MLEAVVRQYREEGGDVYLVGIRPQVAAMIEASGFDAVIGDHHLLQRENAVGHLFHNVFDPSVCIYECDVRVFAECQALAKHPYQSELPPYVSIREQELNYRSVTEFKVKLDENADDTAVLDVRERREYQRAHIPQAELCPLRVLVDETESFSKDREILLVCRSGRRSARAFGILRDMGFENVNVLKGGMLAWEAAGYPVMME
jgi:SulP family sulfate permease